jgi:hypothetical protein
MCVKFFNVCLNSRRWFVLCFPYITCVGAAVRRKGLALSIGQNGVEPT